MIVLGLAGKAGSGKDTVADYLVKRYGFIKFSFSDALYREVAAAFEVDESLLRDRATKDDLQPTLMPNAALNTAPEFAYLVTNTLGISPTQALSPRQILQWWGTEYRRAQDPLYWIARAEEFVLATRALYQYPEQRPNLFVNTSVRFENERAWVHRVHGNVWHIRRGALAAVNEHVSETPLEVLPVERELYNNDSVERLYHGIELLLSTQAKFVKVEPMLPVEEPKGT